MEIQSYTPVAEVVAHLKQMSGSKSEAELLDFACSLSVIPGAVGHTKCEVTIASKEIRRGVVPRVLEGWYALVRPGR